jgi:hypothetical protein
MIRLTLSTTFAFVICLLPSWVIAYEVINHQDMSEAAAKLSGLGRDQVAMPNGGVGKLFRLGLRQQILNSNVDAVREKLQRFPIAGSFTAECANPEPQPLAAGLTILQLIRFGSCYEDLAEVGAFRSLAHFYNPQDGGSGAAGGTSSPNWSLTRSNLNPLTGANHFTWPDARDSFFNTLTFQVSGLSAADNDSQRRTEWGKTFQSLGHIIHHLQDMGQPQHVRGDTHRGHTFTHDTQLRSTT